VLSSSSSVLLSKQSREFRATTLGSVFPANAHDFGGAVGTRGIVDAARRESKRKG